jgi:transcriptional regulator with XRE-family HTH domain
LGVKLPSWYYNVKTYLEGGFFDTTMMVVVWLSVLTVNTLSEHNAPVKRNHDDGASERPDNVDESVWAIICKIEALRENEKLSKKQFSLRLGSIVGGTSDNLWNKIQSGENALRADHITASAQIFGVSRSVIVGAEDDDAAQVSPGIHIVLPNGERQVVNLEARELKALIQLAAIDRRKGDVAGYLESVIANHLREKSGQLRS